MRKFNAWLAIAGLLVLAVGLHPAWRYLPGAGDWIAPLGVLMLGFAVFALMTRGNDGADG